MKKIKIDVVRKGIFTFSLFTFHFSLLFAQSWQPIGTAIQDTGGNSILSLAVYNNELYAGGYIDGKCPTNNIARWNNIKWDSVGSGVQKQGVYSMVPYDSMLFVGGSFYQAGGINSSTIAQWNGTSWDSLRSGLSQGGGEWIEALSVYEGQVYLAGEVTITVGGHSFYGIARWDGNTFDSVGPAIDNDGQVYGLAVYKGELYAIGLFSKIGGINAASIAKWDGTKWDSVGSGLKGWGVGPIALCVYNDKLYAGGDFTSAGGIKANYIACWDGTKWDSVSSGITRGTGGYVYSLCAYNGNLYAGGLFTSAGGNLVSNIAKWDGTKWSAVGAGFNEGPNDFGVTTLCVYDSSLYAGGDFTKSGATTVMGIASWRDSVILSENQLKINNEKLKIYPNPSNGVFTVAITNYELGIKNTIEVYNMLGENVYSTTLSSTNTQIDLSNKPEGIYLYRVVSENGSFIGEGKFVIQ